MACLFPYRRHSYTHGQVKTGMTYYIQHTQRSHNHITGLRNILCLLKHRGEDSKARRDEHTAEVCNRECTELFKTKQGLCKR